MRNSISAAIFAAVTVLTVSLNAEDAFLKIKNLEVFGNLSRGEVMFPHEKHYSAIECLRCHHRYDKGINVLLEDELQPGTDAVQCSSCHKTGRELERAYHRMCIRCHSEMNKNRTVSGPVMCGLCHVKKGK